jgi:hypothetical protein
MAKQTIDGYEANISLTGPEAIFLWDLLPRSAIVAKCRDGRAIMAKIENFIGNMKDTIENGDNDA